MEPILFYGKRVGMVLLRRGAATLLVPIHCSAPHSLMSPLPGITCLLGEGPNCLVKSFKWGEGSGGVTRFLSLREHSSGSGEDWTEHMMGGRQPIRSPVPHAGSSLAEA